MKADYVVFTEEMKKDYTILVPNMLPTHFKFIIKVLENYGYNLDLLQTSGKHISETGLKYVHNDTCYPAILVIGQFIDAIQSGKYDPHKVALILFQTGGGCRASNYIFLLRKALAKAGYGYVPVISFNLSGMESHPGFKLTLPILHRMLYAILYGDLLMSLTNQCKPYEVKKGASEALAEKWTEKLSAELAKPGRISYPKIKKNLYNIIKNFRKIERNRTRKVAVGVVGEIFVKYSPLGNNNLESFLNGEGAEVVVPGLFDFCLYCAYNTLADIKYYKIDRKMYPVYKIGYNMLLKKQQDLIDMIEEDGLFDPPTPFPHLIELVKGYIDVQTKMGEGWLLTAEMLELYERGIKNIVCTQPFGCLPNHICGKGMMKPIKAKKHDINIVAIDYDAGASKVNQENRLKLMLANAQK